MSNPTNNALCADTNGKPQLGDSLDIAHAAAIREELLAHAAMRCLRFDLGNIVSCDLAGLQLLLAARASATAGDISLQLDNPSVAVLTACRTFGIELETTSPKP